MRTTLAVLTAALASAGCIAVSARAHVAAVTDLDRHGVQAGVNLGLGYAMERTAVVASTGIETGNAPALGLHSTIDVVRLPDDVDERFAWRAGFGTAHALIGEPTQLGVRAASLFVLRDRARHSSGGKGFSSSFRSVIAVGLDAAFGLHLRETDDPESPERGPGGSAGVTFEVYALSRMR